MERGNADEWPAGRDGDGGHGPGGPLGEWLDAGSLLQHVGHAVIATDMPGVVHYWNAAAEALYGWSPAEVVGRNIADVAVPPINRALAVEIMATLQGGGSWSGAFTVRRKDGSTFPALVTDTAIRDRSGVPVGIVGVSVELGQAVWPLLQRSSDAAVILTRNDRVTLVSPAGAVLFGWTEEQVLGRSFWELLHPEDVAACQDFYRRAVGTGNGASPVECRVARFPSGWAWAEMVVTDMLHDPSARYVVCNLRNVTDRHDDREQLVRLTEQLQTALTTRVVIEQAKGILAERHGVGVDQAFETLRQHSRSHNARIHDVAAAVVNLGLQI